jgi:hypothetical protein
MGSYAQCWLDEFYVGSTKNGVDHSLMGLFRWTDKYVVVDPSTSVPNQLQHWLSDGEEGPLLPIVYYEAPIYIVKDRLDLLGYTRETASEAFAAYVEGERDQYERWIKQPADGVGPSSSAIMREHWERSRDLLSKLTVDSWLEGLREIRTSGLKPDRYRRHEGLHDNSLLDYQLSKEWYGFPGADLNVALRLALEVCPHSQSLLYDLTDLVLSGYVSPEDDLIEQSIDISSEDYQANSKIIVLTEGKTDAEILKESLVVLYPHLADYYSFMEFDLVKVGGGAGNLANIVKAFAGAGIANRTIALFDNDSAAAASLKALERVVLPPHIRTLRLPDIDLLRHYPTLGPTGAASMDVNGVAASIELYLGEDVLRVGQQFAPVQWTGFDVGLQRYQGEVLEKQKIQERFFEKLQLAKANGLGADALDWRGLRSIFERIFAAFHEFNNKRICGWARTFRSG